MVRKGAQTYKTKKRKQDTKTITMRKLFCKERDPKVEQPGRLNAQGSNGREDEHEQKNEDLREAGEILRKNRRGKRGRIDLSLREVTPGKKKKDTKK